MAQKNPNPHNSATRQILALYANSMALDSFPDFVLFENFLAEQDLLNRFVLINDALKELIGCENSVYWLDNCQSAHVGGSDLDSFRAQILRYIFTRLTELIILRTEYSSKELEQQFGEILSQINLSIELHTKPAEPDKIALLYQETQRPCTLLMPKHSQKAILFEMQNSPGSPATAWTKFKNILYWCFPLTWLWELGKFTCTNLIGSLIGRQLAPNGRTGQIILDELLLHPQIAPPPKQHYLIIQFPGSGATFWQYYPDLLEHAMGLGATTVNITYPPAKSQNDLVDSGICVVKHYLALGFAPENITLSGHSLGGAVATLVAKHFHDRGIRLKVFNDRSFSSISDVIFGYIRNRIPLLGTMLAYLSYPIVKAVLLATNWDLNVAKVYRSLPAEYRQHICIDNKLERSLQDSVIYHADASLDRTLSPERQKIKSQISGQSARQNKKQELAERKMRFEIKVPNFTEYNPHCEPLSQLKTRQNASALNLFYRFVQSKRPDHDPSKLPHSAAAGIKAN